MTNEMTTALELAGFLEGGSDQFNAEAAAELRRLHAINAELVEAIEAQLNPSWECNSDHPKLYTALEKAKQ